MSKGNDTLVIYRQDYDILVDPRVRIVGTKLISDEFQYTVRMPEEGPAQNYVWRHTRPEPTDVSYIVDTDQVGQSDDADLIKVECANAKRMAEQGEWYTRTKQKDLTRTVATFLMCFLGVVCAGIFYLEYERRADLGRFITRYEREIEQAETLEAIGGQLAEQVEVAEPPAESGAVSGDPVIPPTPPTPVPTPDFS